MGGASEVIPGVVVHLRTDADGPTVESEAVKGSDLADAMAELAFNAGLRRDGTPLALSDLRARIRPAYRSSPDAAPICDGFVLEAEATNGEKTSRRFDRHVLESVAARGGRRLLESGTLEKGEFYYYEVQIEETTIGPLEIEGAASPPPPTRSPLGPLLAAAKQISAERERGLEDEVYALEHASPDVRPPRFRASSLHDPVDSDAVSTDIDSLHYPVVYLRSAFDKAAAIARKGAAMTPAVETGGLLLGRLFWCPETHQLFGVIEDALEAAQTEGTTYSLTFTSETWGRVQAVLKARQRSPSTRGQRLVGQFHGHNFIPFSQGATCDGCPSQGECSISTAYLSESDRKWCRAVFPREPWQLSQVFGLTPRREAVSAFYGQYGGLLERRDYYVLDD